MAEEALKRITEAYGKVFEGKPREETMVEIEETSSKDEHREVETVEKMKMVEAHNKEKTVPKNAKLKVDDACKEVISIEEVESSRIKLNDAQEKEGDTNLPGDDLGGSGKPHSEMHDSLR